LCGLKTLAIFSFIPYITEYRSLQSRDTGLFYELTSFQQHLVDSAFYGLEKKKKKRKKKKRLADKKKEDEKGLSKKPQSLARLLAGPSLRNVIGNINI
jgi:hypothetical protein